MSDCAWSVSPLLALSLIVIISSSVCFLLMFCAFSGQPDRLDKYNSQTLLTAQTVHGRVKRCNTGNSEQKKQKKTLELSPSVSGKHIIGMSEAIAAGQRTMGQFLFVGLPGKRQTVDRRLLLSFGSQWTTACTAMGCVFS